MHLCELFKMPRCFLQHNTINDIGNGTDNMQDNED